MKHAAKLRTVLIAAIVIVAICLPCLIKIARFRSSTAPTKQAMEDLRAEAAEAYGFNLTEGERLKFWRHPKTTEEYPAGDYILIESGFLFLSSERHDDTLHYVDRFISLQKSIEPPNDVERAEIVLFIVVGILIYAAVYVVAERSENHQK